MKIEIRLAAEMKFFADPEGTDEQFEAFLDEVMDQLPAIGREESSSQQGCPTTRRVRDVG